MWLKFLFAWCCGVLNAVSLVLHWNFARASVMMLLLLLLLLLLLQVQLVGLPGCSKKSCMFTLCLH
jgi:hypothetical protein